MRKLFSLIAGGILFVLAVRPSAAQNAETDERDGPGVVVFVRGMFCENCAYAVEKRVGKLEGVSSVEVHLDEQEVRVTLVPGEKVSDEDLREAILDAGFEPVEVHHPGSAAKTGRDADSGNTNGSLSDSIDVHRR